MTDRTDDPELEDLADAVADHDKRAERAAQSPPKSELPHVLRTAVLQLKGREIGCALLSNRRRVLFETPVQGMLEGMSEGGLDLLHVRYLADDGAELAGLDVRMLVEIAEGWMALARVPATATPERKHLASECRAFIYEMAVLGFDALIDEATRRPS